MFEVGGEGVFSRFLKILFSESRGRLVRTLLR